MASTDGSDGNDSSLNKSSEMEMQDMHHNSKSKFVFGLLLVLVVSVAINLNTLEGILLYDDTEAISTNDDTDPFKTNLTSIFVNDWWGVPMCNEHSHKCYRPFTVITLRWDRLIAGLEPFQYHLSNIGYHAVCCCLVTILAMVMSHRFCNEQGVWAGVAVGLLFAVHPIHTEAVANIVGRAELLSGIFFCLAVLMYISILTRNPDPGLTASTLSVLACTLFATVALLCKEQGITAMGVCILLDAAQVLRRRYRRFRIACLVLFAAISFALRLKLNCGSQPRWDSEQNPVIYRSRMVERFLTFVYLGFYHMKLLVFPHPLCYTYAGPAIPIVTSTYDPRNLGGICLLVCGIGLGFVYFDCKRVVLRNVLLISAIFAVVPFVPATNILFHVGFVIAERTLYIPSIGFVFLLGMALAKLRQKWFAVSTIILIALCILGGMRSVTRNEDWNSAMTLYQQATEHFPHCPAHLYNIGVTYEEQGDLIKAEEYYRKALEQDGKYARALGNLGKILSSKGKFKEAEIFLKETASLNPESKTQCDLGAIYLQQGKLELAEKHLSNPNNVECLSMLGIAKSQLGKRKEAEQIMLRTMEMAPNHDNILCNVAAFYTSSNPSKAEEIYKKALKVNPNNTVAQQQLKLLSSSSKTTSKTQKQSFHIDRNKK